MNVTGDCSPVTFCAVYIFVVHKIVNFSKKVVFLQFKLTFKWTSNRL